MIANAPFACYTDYIRYKGAEIYERYQNQTQDPDPDDDRGIRASRRGRPFDHVVVKCIHIEDIFPTNTSAGDISF